MKFYVITGPSSSGKSTLINHLSQRGFPVIKEVARSVLAERALHPSKDPYEFQNEIARRQLAEEEKARMLAGQLTFLDRGLYDQIAFCRHFGVKKLPAALMKTNSYDAAFILEPITDFEKDGIRIENNIAEAISIKDMVVEEYKKRQIPCVHIPALSVEKRADLILYWIKRHHQITV